MPSPCSAEMVGAFRRLSLLKCFVAEGLTFLQTWIWTYHRHNKEGAREVPCNLLASSTWWVGGNKPPQITLYLKRIYKKLLRKKTHGKSSWKRACLCLTFWDFMPNSFISPKPQHVQSIKQHSQNGNNRELQPLPYLEVSHRDSSSRVEMGVRRLIWERIG